MGKPKMKDFDIPDPLAIIEAEKQANRTDQVTPFGSTVWQGDQQITTLSPEMQAMSDRMFDLGMQDSQRVQQPAWLGDIVQGIGQNVGERYGVNIGNKPKQATAPPPMSMPVEPSNMEVVAQQPQQQQDSIDQQMAQLRDLIQRSGGGNYQDMIQTRMR